MADDRLYFDLAKQCAQRVNERLGATIDPEWIYAQWRHESGNFTSQLSVENNNFGGLTQVEPNGEENKQPDGNNYYKVFDSPEDYANYYADYLCLYAEDGLSSVHTLNDFATVLKQGGYYDDTVENYTNALNNMISMADPITAIGAYPTTSFFYSREDLPTVGRNEPNKERGVWERFSDAFVDANLDSGDTSAVRYLWSWLNPKVRETVDMGEFVIPGYEKTYIPTEEEKGYVSDLLKGDEAAQDFVLSSAHSKEHLYMLAAMKKEDYDRQIRLLKDSMHESTNIAGIVGGLAGGLATPLTLASVIVPVAGGGVVAKAVGRLGLSAFKLSKFAKMRAVKFAAKAGTGASIMGMDRYLANVYGGFTPNYAMNMAMGGALGSAFDAFRLIKNKIGKQVEATELYNRINRIENNTLALTYDTLPATHFKSILQAELKPLQKLKAIDAVIPKRLKKEFIAGEKLFILADKDLKAIMKKYNIKAPENAKYITIPGTDIRIFNADKIGSNKTTERLIAQDEMVADLEDRVEKAIGDKWKKTAPEDATLIDYLADMKANNPLSSTIIKALRKQWQSEGIDVKGLSDKNILEMINLKADNIRQGSKVYHITPDGTFYYGGVPIDKYNPMNPITEVKWLEDATKVEKRMQGFLPKFMRIFNLSKHLETGTLFSTPYGSLSNSRIVSVSRLAHALFHDDRMRGVLYDTKWTNTVSAERIKKQQAYPLLGMLDGYFDLRNAWIKRNNFSKWHGQGRAFFDKQVMDYYNWQYADNKAGHVTKKALSDWEDEVVKAGDTIKRIRDEVIAKGKEDAEFHGGSRGVGSFIDKDWEAPTANEMIRHVDEDALARWVSKRFGNNRKQAITYLERYAHIAGRKDMLAERMQKQLDKDSPGTKLTSEEIQEQFDKECRDWATGIIDKNNSRITFNGGNHTYGDNPISFMKSRFPMDTSKKLDDGFSFDDVLRDNDVESLMRSYIDRMTGEIALHDVLGDWRNNGILDKLSQDWEKARGQLHGLSESKVAEERYALEEGLSRILGMRSSNTPRTFFSAFSNLIRTQTYADVGGQMFAAQLGEYGGAFGYAGSRVLLRNLPIVRNLRKAMLSKETKEIEKVGEEAVNYLYGKELSRRIWDSNSSYTFRSFRDVLSRGSKLAQMADKVGTVSKICSNITSTLNQLPRLTDEMINQGRIAGIIDSIEWGLGKQFDKKVRNPFSSYYLRAVGVKTEKEIANLRGAIGKYLGKKPTGEELTKALETWRMTDSTTYFQWRNLMDNYSNKVIQQMSIGGTPLGKEKNAFRQLFFQFKDYTFRAVNSQMMRALSSRQKDDCLAALYSMGTNTVSYMGLVYLRAGAKYPNDPEARQQYIERNLTPGRLAWAAVSRGALTGSLPSFGSDIWEIATGESMMRTTVNNSYKNRGKISGDAEDIAGRVISQLPAIHTIVAPLMQVGKVGSRLVQREQMTKEDLRDLSNCLPLNGWIGTTLLASELSDLIDAPTRKEQKERQKQSAKILKPAKNSKKINALKPPKVPLKPNMSHKPEDKKTTDNKSAGMSLILGDSNK